MLEYLLLLIPAGLACYCCFVYGQIREMDQTLKVIDSWIKELENKNEWV